MLFDTKIVNLIKLDKDTNTYLGRVKSVKLEVNELLPSSLMLKDQSNRETN